MPTRSKRCGSRPRPWPRSRPSPTSPGHWPAWRVLGAFPIDSPSPFPIDKPVDLSAKYTDRKGQPAAWRPSAPVDGQGTIDLGQLFGRDDKLAAFGYYRGPEPDGPPGSHADRLG